MKEEALVAPGNRTTGDWVIPRPGLDAVAKRISAHYRKSNHYFPSWSRSPSNYTDWGTRLWCRDINVVCSEKHRRCASALGGQNAQFLGAFATVSFVMSVCPSAWNNTAPTGRIFVNFIYECVSKICQENSSFVKIWQERRIFYMKTSIHLWSYLAHFF